MNSVSRRRNLPTPPVKYCKVHANVPVAPNSEYCPNCKFYRDQTKERRAKAPETK